MIASSVGTNARVLASTPAFAPRRVRVLLIMTISAYRPGQTLIVSPGLAAATAALIVVKAVVRSLQLVALANPSSSTTSVAASATAPCPPIATTPRTAPSARAKTVIFRIARLPSASFLFEQDGSANVTRLGCDTVTLRLIPPKPTVQPES